MEEHKVGETLNGIPIIAKRTPKGFTAYTEKRNSSAGISGYFTSYAELMKQVARVNRQNSKERELRQKIKDGYEQSEDPKTVKLREQAAEAKKRNQKRNQNGKRGKK